MLLPYFLDGVVCDAHCGGRGRGAAHAGLLLHEAHVGAPLAPLAPLGSALLPPPLRRLCSRGFSRLVLAPPALAFLRLRAVHLILRIKQMMPWNIETFKFPENLSVISCPHHDFQAVLLSVCCPQTILRMMQASWVVPLEGSYEQYVSWDVIVFERKNTTLIISWITFNDRSFRKCIIIVCFALKKVISKLLGRACSACSK